MIDAIYWASVGLKRSKKKDLITLRRVIYQSMQMAVLRGRIISLDPIWVGPDLSKIDRANAAYEQMIEDDAEMRHAIQTAHRNFLKDAIYLLYTHNRLAQAGQWFKRIREKYPDAIPANQTLDEWTLQKVMGTVSDGTHDRTQAILEGIIAKRFIALAVDDDEQAEGYDRMARQIWRSYDDRIKMRKEPLKFPPLPEMEKEVLQNFISPESRFNPELKARLQTKLGIKVVPGNASTNTNRVPKP